MTAKKNSTSAGAKRGSMGKKPKVVDYLILGNSAAAIAAVEKIRATDKAGSILMVSPEPYKAYGRPLISYMLEGKTDMDRMDLKSEDFYETNHVQTLFGAGNACVSLDAKAHTATLENGSVVTYGSVLVATGSVPFVPPIPGLREAENVYSFLCMDDALAASAAAKDATQAAHECGNQSRVVIIGAGLIGLKAAEALVGHVDDVVVLEMAPRILPAVLDQQGADILKDALIERGITCLPGITAETLVVEEGETHSAHLTDGTDITFDFVVAAVGVRPNATLLADAGATIGRGAVCDSAMRTDLPDVYAAGDVTQTVDTLDGSQKCLALWPNAVIQGKVAGANMAGAPDAPQFEGNFAVNAVDFFDISLLTSGVINPPEDGGFNVDVVVRDNTYAKFVSKNDRLFGYILMNRPENAGIYTATIEHAVPLSSLAEGFFSAAPQNLEYPADARWDRLHRGYPKDLDRCGWKERA